MRQSLAQRRAEHALAHIEALHAENDYGNYKSFVQALPATIIASGLGQALAMEKAGAGKNAPDVAKGHGKLLEHLESWLCNKGGNGWESSRYDSPLINAIVRGSEAEYIRAQAEAMQYLEWLTKFGVAFLIDPDAKAGEPGEEKS